MNSRLQKINFLDEGLFFPTSGRKTGKVAGWHGRWNMKATAR
jgi:hypothetical protein